MHDHLKCPRNTAWYSTREQPVSFFVNWLNLRIGLTKWNSPKQTHYYWNNHALSPICKTPIFGASLSWTSKRAEKCQRAASAKRASAIWWKRTGIGLHRGSLRLPANVGQRGWAWLAGGQGARDGGHRVQQQVQAHPADLLLVGARGIQPAAQSKFLGHRRCETPSNLIINEQLLQAFILNTRSDYLAKLSLSWTLTSF